MWKTVTLTLTLTFHAQNHVTSSTSQGHSPYQVLTLWGYSFLSYAPKISVKNALIDLVTLTFNLSITNPRHF